MRGRAVWAIGSGVALWLTAAAAQAQCTKDTDCKGDRVCEAGKCTSPPPSAAPQPPAAVVEPQAPAAAEPPAATVQTQAPAPAATTPTPSPPPADLTAAPPPAAPVGPPVAREPQPAPEAALTPVDVPPAPRRSRAAMAAGIIMVSVGSIALLGALTAKSSLDECDDSLENDYPDLALPTSQRYRLEECDGYSATAYVLGIGGAVLAVGGIPLIIYGAKRVPLAAPAASLNVSPWATQQAGGVKLRLTL